MREISHAESLQRLTRSRRRSRAWHRCCP